MKKCIKIVLFFSIGLFLASCTNKEDELKIENQQTTNVNEMSFTNNEISGVMDKLNALNSMYGIGSSYNIRRSPGLPSNLSTLPNMSSWSLSNVGNSKGKQIAAADANGALSGALKGADLGDHLAGYEGALVGAIIGGVVGGAVKSIQAARLDSTNHCMAVIENPLTYNSLPGCSNNNYINTTIPTGMEIGTYHNTLIAYILNEYDLSTLTSPDEIYDIVVDNLDEGLGTYFDASDLENMQELFGEYRYDILSTYQGNIDAVMDSLGLQYELEIIKHYAYSVSSEESYFDLRSYTLSYINIINAAFQAEILSESSTLLINAYISTLESSKELWNLTTPDPYTSNVFVLYSANNGWDVANGISEYESLISLNQYDFAGFPVFIDGVLTRVYIKDDFPYNEDYASAYVANLFNTGIFDDENTHLYYHNISDYVDDGRFYVHAVDGYFDSYKYIDFTEPYIQY